MSEELPEFSLRGRFARRALLLGAGQIGLFGLLGWRLRQLQILDSSEYRLLSDENRLSVQLVAPIRGAIYDRFGIPIAQNRENLRVLVVPGYSKNLAETLASLSRIFPISQADNDRVLRHARRQSGYLPILVSEDLNWRQFALLNVLAPDFPGVQTDSGSVRTYSHATSMAHIVGYVGMAAQREVNEDPMMRLPGFRTGKAGVERGFDRALRGSAGSTTYEADARGRVVRKLGSTHGTQGKDVVLSVDQGLQEFALNRLAEFRRASLVAMDCNTGEVLAMASTPTYDPNDITFKPDPKRFAELARAEDNPFNNLAVRGLYPPGSTFKVVTALAGLASGVITEKDHVGCPGGYSLGRAYFRCWKPGGHGRMDVHDAIKQSCDVFFYETARRMGIDTLAAMGRKLGLEQIYRCGLAGQKKGVMPTVAWKRANLGLPWYGGETVIAGIGQGFVLTTPLQLAVMTARVATGKAVVPRLTASGANAVKIAAALDLDPHHLDLVRAGMIGVVNEPGGTAGRAALTIPDVQMAGKTGTSQVVSSRGGRRLQGWEGETHALFIAYAPIDTPRYAVVCVVEHGGGGSRVASPVVHDVMTELLLRDPSGRPAFVARNDAPERQPVLAEAGGAR